MRYLYLAILIVALAAGIAGLEFAFELAGGSLSIYNKSGASIILLYLTALVIVGVFVAIAAPQSIGRYRRLYANHKAVAARGFATMFGLGSLMVIGLFVLLLITGNLTWAEDGPHRLATDFAGKMIIGTIGAIALAISEELLFRGFLLRYLRWNDSTAVTVSAVVVSSLIFAFVHNLRDPLGWLTPQLFPLFVGLFILGVLLAVTYLVTGSLWCSIGLHAGLVTVGEVLLRRHVIAIDFSPWWLGGANEIRMAPLVWLSFAVTAVIHYATRRDLNARFAIEKPFVGMALDRSADERLPAK
jgi:membrane protease YdiL (CAAX protease family)